MRQLRGKRVFISGGAQGIGFAMARAFAREGAELVLSDVAEETLDEAVQTLRGEGVPVSGYTLDVTDVEAVKALPDRIAEDIGPIDVLVNNAGVVFGGSFLELPLDKHLLTYRVNVLGLVAVTHAFLPMLLDRPDAHLVNIASASGLVGLAFGSTYSSSKWAVVGLSESLRYELEQLGHDHVGVTSVCPGFIDTGMFEGVTPPRFMPMLTPQRVADKVIQAVRHDHAFVLEPLMVKTIPLLKALVPNRLLDRLNDRLGATQAMRGWRGKH